MSKKTIVLADNSYTIRRIVELSFSEEEDIDLASFENSINLKEKLLELRPAIVLVDIKLPEFNGYEVCKYVNNTESLKHTKVFLLKGGFEPVDENQLRGLRFVDIITKPFDSNALVSTIKNLLREDPSAGLNSQPEEMPSSIPEYMAEVENLVEADDEISFSDVKEVVSPDLLSAASVGIAKGPSVYPDDEVLPSEEITQAQSSQPDTLAPVFTNAEDIDNPFQEDEMSVTKPSIGEIYNEDADIKRNIELEEREMNINSLTADEMEIKKQINARKMGMFQEKLPDDEFKVSEDEMSAVDGMFSFGMGTMDAENKKGILDDIPDLKAGEVEKEMGLEPDYIEPGMETIKLEEEVVSVIEEGSDSMQFADFYQPPSPFTEKPGTRALSIEEEMSFSQPTEALEMENPGSISGMETPDDGISVYDDFGNGSELELETYPSVMEYEIPSPPSPPSPPSRTSKSPQTSSVPPQVPPKQGVRQTPTSHTPAATPTMSRPPKSPGPTMPPISPMSPPLRQSARPTSPASPTFAQSPTPSTPPMSPNAPMRPKPMSPNVPPSHMPPPQPKQAARPAPPPPMNPVNSKPPMQSKPSTSPAQPRPAEAAKPLVRQEKNKPAEESLRINHEIPAMENEKILSKVEDKLSLAVKEMLWEIVPPLAERIIKEEIEKIENEVAKSLK